MRSDVGDKGEGGINMFLSLPPSLAWKMSPNLENIMCTVMVPECLVMG